MKLRSLRWLLLAPLLFLAFICYGEEAPQLLAELARLVRKAPLFICLTLGLSGCVTACVAPEKEIQHPTTTTK